MILLIIKSYLTILLSVGIGSIFIFIIGMYLILKKSTSTKQVKSNFVSKVTSPEMHQTTSTGEADNIHDLSAIAGDDVISTQLDLARAYIETGRIQLAKNILEFVIEQGNAAQQEEARQLMN